MLIKVIQDALGEYCLIELQGDLESNEPLDGQHLGSLVQQEQKVRPRQWLLTIGNHILTGKEETLGKALTIVQKQGAILKVLGKVSKKILFGTRPATIPDSQAPKTKFNFAQST